MCHPSGECRDGGDVDNFANVGTSFELPVPCGRILDGVYMLLGYEWWEVVSTKSACWEGVIHFPNVEDGYGTGLLMGADVLGAD